MARQPRRIWPNTSTTLPFTPLNDLRRQLVYCENGSSVRTVIVNGEVVMRDGQLLTVDEKALRAEIRSMAGEIERYCATAEPWPPK